MGKVLCVGRVGNASESGVKESNALGVMKQQYGGKRNLGIDYALKVSDGLKNYVR